MTFNILPYFRRFYIISFLLCLQRKTVKNFTIFYGFSTILTGFFSLKSFLFLTFQQLCPDISRKLKDSFSLIYLESIERRFRRFFKSFSSVAYSFYEAFISYVISHFFIKHHSSSIHISFDHMFCKDKFTILLFSLRIGKQRYSSLVSLL